MNLSPGPIILTVIPAFVMLLAGADWPAFRVNEVEMSFKMPSKPTLKHSMFQNAPATFYTTDTANGRFVAGYIKFPAELQPTMQKQIRTDPGSAALHGLLEGTVAGFAKGGNAKIVDPAFGVDLGLPTEYVTLSSPKATVHMRVYIGAKATYIFISTANVDTSEHYFESIKLPPEVGKA